MHPHDFLLAALALFSEFLGTLSGFGSSTFFVPAAIFFESFTFVLALTAILHCFGNVAKIAAFREHLPRRLVVQLALPSVIFAGIGAMLTAQVPVALLTRLLGIALVAISVASFFLKRRSRPISPGAASAVCGFSGFMTGLVGTGGAIRGVALAALQIEKNSFVAVSAAIDLVGDLLRAVIYVRQGYMDWSQWFYLPLFGVAAVAGAFGGKMALGRIHQHQFEKIVAGFILLGGLGMIFG